MASPFNLSKSGKGKSGASEYNALLAKNMKRFKDRDAAVRNTNIATGHGNSTAQRFMHEGSAKAAPAAKSGGGAGKKTDRRKTSSTKRKGNFSLPVGPTSVANTPPTRSPTSVPNSPPAMGPTTVPNGLSPYHPSDPMSAGAPHGMSMSGTGYVPPPPPPDIGAPGQPIVGMGGPVGAGRPPVGMGGPVGAGRPPVGMGGPVGAGNPVISMPEGAPGRPPVGMGGASGAGQAPYGMGGASGAGGSVVDPSIIRWLLGLG